LFSALIGQWRYSLLTATLTATMQIAERAYSLAQEQNDPSLLLGAHRILAVTLYFSGDFKAAEQHAKRGVEIWHGGGIQSRFEEVNSPALVCLSFGALCAWHFGEIAACKAEMAQAVSFAKDSNDAYALAVALFHAAFASHFDGNVAEVESLAAGLTEMSTRQHFAQWRAAGRVFGGWARSASGSTEGIAWIEEAIREWRGLGAVLVMPYWLGLKAEALHFADRLPEALETIREAEALAKASGERWWLAELCRLRALFLACVGEDEIQIEGSFFESMRIANEQKSISLEKRAQATYAEYRRQKVNPSEGGRIQLPLS
jgi:predicted ATPase